MAAVLETKEKAMDEVLATHYFRASYKQIKEVYIEFLERLGHNIISVNDDYFEIASEYGNMSVIAKIIMQTPLETSIDFYINIESLFGGTGKGKKFMLGAYSAIEEKYNSIGTGLHK